MNDFSEQTMHNLARMPNAKIGFIINDENKFFHYKCCLNTLQLFEKDLLITDNKCFYEVINLTTNTVLTLCRPSAKARTSRSNLIFTDASISEEDWHWSEEAAVSYQLL